MKALVVGSAGQDGTLLSGHLRELGYEVRGITKADLSIVDPREVEDTVATFGPDEIYFLAAYHHSSQDPPVEPLVLFQTSFAVHVAALLCFLEAIRKRAPRARLFYAASSLIFGDPIESPQTETTPFDPTDAYGITKAAGVQVCRHYRRVHSVYAAVGILYNHESPLRAEKFVTKKIVKAAWEIKRGTRDKLVLGNLSAELDVGYAPEYVAAMRGILALDAPDDFIVATGETHTVRELVELAFAELGLDWQRHVEEDRGLITRPALRRVGDPRKLLAATGWRASTSFAAMVQALIDAESSHAV